MNTKFHGQHVSSRRPLQGCGQRRMAGAWNNGRVAKSECTVKLLAPSRPRSVLRTGFASSTANPPIARRLVEGVTPPTALGPDDYTPGPPSTLGPDDLALLAVMTLMNLGPDGTDGPDGPDLLAATDDYTPSDLTADTVVQPTTTSKFSGIKAFVAGASGRTGKAIVERLVAEGIPVRALVRDMAKAAVLPSVGVTPIKGDVYQYTTLADAIGDSDSILVATGGNPLDPLGPFNVDYQGMKNIVAVAKNKGVKRIIMVSSIGTDHPFFFLIQFFGVLFWKKRAEEHLQRSGIDFTVVRPGGLQDNPRQGSAEGGIIMAGPDAFGLPPRRGSGSILRKQVADICVGALVEEGAKNKVVEVISNQTEPHRSLAELFAMV